MMFSKKISNAGGYNKHVDYNLVENIDAHAQSVNVINEFCDSLSGIVYLA